MALVLSRTFSSDLHNQLSAQLTATKELLATDGLCRVTWVTWVLCYALCRKCCRRQALRFVVTARSTLQMPERLNKEMHVLFANRLASASDVSAVGTARLHDLLT